MGTKSNKNISGIIGAIGAVGGLITAVTPLVEKAIDNAQNKPTEKIDTKVIIPELYRKGFPIDLEQMCIRDRLDCVYLVFTILIMNGLKTERGI